MSLSDCSGRASTSWRRLACAGLLLALVPAVGCQSKGPAGGAAAGAAEGEEAPAPRTAGQKEIYEGMVAAAKNCKEAGGNVGDVQRCTGWRMLMTRQRRIIDGYNPRVPDSVAPAVERMEVAWQRLGHSDPWMRAIARSLLEKGLIVSANEPNEDRQPWLNALARRLDVATDTDERLDLVRLLGNYGGATEEKALLKAAQESGEPKVRSAAWAAISRCISKGCKPQAAAVEAGWQAEMSPEARGGLVVLAGRLRLESLLTWCTPQALDDEHVGESCRSALRFLGGDQAFERLYARARQLVMNAPADQGDVADGVAARALVDLAPLGALPSAGGRFFELVDTYLSQKRVGQGPLQAAQQLLVVPDRERATDLAIKHFEALKASGRTDQTAELLASRLRRVILTLGGGARIGANPNEDPMNGPVGIEPGQGEEGHGHDHGGPDHAGHDHGGHDHGGHDHGGHGPAGHGPGSQDDPAAPAPGPRPRPDRGDRDRGALIPTSAAPSAPASAP